MPTEKEAMLKSMSQPAKPTPQSPTPWKVTPKTTGTFAIENKTGFICTTVGNFDVDKANAAYIVECCNAHAALQAENAELREALKNLHHELEIVQGMDWKINANLAMARRHAFEVINK
jgi:hypothetical protein